MRFERFSAPLQALAVALVITSPKHAFAQGATDVGDKRQPQKLAELVRSLDQASIDEGFVIHLYSDEDVRQIENATAEHNRLHQEFSAKRELLAKRSQQLNRDGVSNVSRTLSSADRLFARYDKDRNGILDETEFAGVQRTLKDSDVDGDGRVEKKEFVR